MGDNREEARTKVGAGTLQAMGRLSLHELRNALYPSSNVASHPEAGMYGTALPSEVAEQRQGELRHSAAPSHSVLANRLKEMDHNASAPTNERDHSGPHLERE